MTSPSEPPRSREAGEFAIEPLGHALDTPSLVLDVA
jgi:hypothetical protein